MSLLPRRDHSPEGRKKSDFFNLSSFLEDVQEGFKSLAPRPSGLTISSDDKNIYVSADVPGLTAKEVDVSIDNDGCLWIKGEKTEEKKNKERTFYKKSQSSYSYCVPLWNEIDESVEPQASCKNGVMHVTFAKKKEAVSEGKKIRVEDK